VTRPIFRNSKIRRATEADFPMMMEICRARYGDRAAEAEKSIPWMRWHLNNVGSLVLVGADTMGVASVSVLYGVEKRARLDMLATRPVKSAPLEALQMVKAMVRWAAINGAGGAFRIDADTGVDFGPFARRLGGTEVPYPRYDIPLDGGEL